MEAVPTGIDLGVHLCYGDYDGRHAVEPVDGTALTALANLLADATVRDLRWVHLPVPVERDDPSYFEPFSDLRLRPDTDVFLGLLHLADGAAGARRRMAMASRYVGAFGVATECGIGRVHTTPEVEAIIDLHAEVAGG